MSFCLSVCVVTFVCRQHVLLVAGGYCIGHWGHASLLVICSLMLCHISRVCVLKMLASVFFAKVASINFVLDYTRLCRDMTRLCRVPAGLGSQGGFAARGFAARAHTPWDVRTTINIEIPLPAFYHVRCIMCVHAFTIAGLVECTSVICWNQTCEIWCYVSEHKRSVVVLRASQGWRWQVEQHWSSKTEGQAGNPRGANSWITARRNASLAGTLPLQAGTVCYMHVLILY